MDMMTDPGKFLLGLSGVWAASLSKIGYSDAAAIARQSCQRVEQYLSYSVWLHACLLRRCSRQLAATSACQVWPSWPVQLQVTLLHSPLASLWYLCLKFHTSIQRPQLNGRTTAGLTHYPRTDCSIQVTPVQQLTSSTGLPRFLELLESKTDGDTAT